jgi:hypothetical protein
MLSRAALSGLLGMTVGMTLVLFALSMRPTGVVTTLACDPAWKSDPLRRGIGVQN